MTTKAYPWSYSHIKQFETCPKQFYHARVLKEYPFEETPEIRYGNELHKAAEHYIRDGKPLPDRFNFTKAALDRLNNFSGDKLCEYKMGLTKDLEPCTFFDKQVWWRGVVDLAIVNGSHARVIDYKTGNSNYADTGQLELMALATFRHFPDVEQVKAALLFVISNKLIPGTYSRDDEPKLWQKWLKKYHRMRKAHQTGVWNTNPSGLCKRHCPVTACVHNGRNQ